MFYNYDDIVTVDQLTEMLCIGKNAAYKLLNRGEIKSFMVGNAYRIPKKEISDYIIRKCRISSNR